MDLRNDLIGTILHAIRARHPTTPVLFPSGHTHYKAFHSWDDHAAAVEAGANFEVEWVSFDLQRSRRQRTWFNFEYIAPSVEEFVRASGRHDAAAFATAEGQVLSIARPSRNGDDPLSSV